jgi:hypothetical protein
VTDFTTDSQVSQGVIDAVLSAIQPLGYTQANIYLVDIDSPPDETLSLAVQIRQHAGTQRHALSGVGLQNGNFSVTVWSNSQLDPVTQATERVKMIQDIAERIRAYVNGSYLLDADGNERVKICCLMTSWGLIEQVFDSVGWIRCTDNYSYSSGFPWRINGTVMNG